MVQASEVWVPQQRHGHAYHQGEEPVEHLGQDEVDEALRFGVVRRVLPRSSSGSKAEEAGENQQTASTENWEQ